MTLVEQIERFMVECGVAGWDGYDACAVRPEAAEIAKAIAARLDGLLIDGRPLHVGPSLDGDIVFSVPGQYWDMEINYFKKRDTDGDGDGC